MDRLPSEILLNIFGNCNYHDLKVTLPMSCRRFRELISDRTKASAIDRALFRDRPRSRPNIPRGENEQQANLTSDSDATEVLDANPTANVNSSTRSSERVTAVPTVHPLFEKLHYHSSYPDIDCLSCTIVNKKRIFASKLNSFHENAVSPAVHELFVHVGYYRPAMIRKPASTEDEFGMPVTVGDVMQWVVGLGYYDDGRRSLPGAALEDIVIGNWTGFEKIEVTDGIVHLYALGAAKRTETNISMNIQRI